MIKRKMNRRKKKVLTVQNRLRVLTLNHHCLHRPHSPRHMHVNLVEPRVFFAFALAQP